MGNDDDVPGINGTTFKCYLNNNGIFPNFGIIENSKKAIVRKVNFYPNISDEELRKMIDDLYANDNSQEREFIIWCNPEVKDAFLKALDIAIKEEVTKMNDNEEVSK